MLNNHKNYCNVLLKKIFHLQNQLPPYIKYLIKVYLIGLIAFGLLRLCLLLFSAEENISFFVSQTREVFLIGVRFDNVVLSYILALPFIVLFIAASAQINNKYITNFVGYFILITLSSAMCIAVAEIPYYNFFKNRLSESAFQWFGAPDVVFEMIISNTNHLLFLLLAILAFITFAYFLHKYTFVVFKKNVSLQTKSTTLKQLIIFVVGALLLFLGMRGRIDHPIRQGDAFFGSDPFLNQIGLNPVFTLIKSYTDKVNLMDEKEALVYTQQLLNATQGSTHVSPIARKTETNSTCKNYNVVIVLMESMSANYMQTFGSPINLTPTLDSLAKQSWLFTNAYSAGIHTNNGIFSSLFSFPALKRTRPMSTIPTRTYSGLPFALKQLGYHNLFFSTHSKTFDDIGTFIPHNFFDELYTNENYPNNKTIGPFGVADDYLFDFAITKLKNLNQPFFATILTTSNHDPYILPNYFESKHTDAALKAVNYADWSIEQFIKNAAKQTWFNNTLFVFVADHGLRVGPQPYDLALSYNHIPLIMFAPQILGTPQILPQLTGQIDIFPMVMNILGQNYTNNTLGIDVLTQNRPFMYFSADDKIGCIDSNWLYVYRYGGNESLYQYKNGNINDYALAEKNRLEKMRKYALAQTQVAEWMFINNKTALDTLK